CVNNYVDGLDSW
nr:immunoglobulin heavy chain junction region [Macaca mulatta]